jgi:hypothetical protein
VDKNGKTKYHQASDTWHDLEQLIDGTNVVGPKAGCVSRSEVLASRNSHFKVQRTSADRRRYYCFFFFFFTRSIQIATITHFLLRKQLHAFFSLPFFFCKASLGFTKHFPFFPFSVFLFINLFTKTMSTFLALFS